MCKSIFGQIPDFISNTSAVDTIKSQVFNHKIRGFDFIIAYHGTSYWSRKKLTLFVLGLKRNKWYLTILREEYGKPEEYEVDTKHPIKSSTRKYRIAKRDIQTLLSTFSQNRIWTLNCDSLDINEIKTSDSTAIHIMVTDGPYYVFEFITKNNFRKVDAYYPSHFLERIPEVYTRQNFINCQEAIRKLLNRKKYRR